MIIVSRNKQIKIKKLTSNDLNYNFINKFTSRFVKMSHIKGKRIGYCYCLFFVKIENKVNNDHHCNDHFLEEIHIFLVISADKNK